MPLFPANSDITDKIQLAVSYFLRITLVIAIVTAMLNQRWTVLFTSSLILFLTYLPNFIERRYKIFLPVEYEFVIILFIYASLFLGEMRGYYTKLWWWDIVLHTGSGLALGFAGFLIIYVLYYKDKIKARAVWIAVFAFCFAVAIGAVWEIFEFSMDQIFKTTMQRTGLIDTMWDLIVDTVGALITAAVGYCYIKGKKLPLFTRLIQKFETENRPLFRNSRTLKKS